MILYNCLFVHIYFDLSFLVLCRSFGFLTSLFYIICLSNLLTLIVPHEDYSRNASYTLNWISAGITFLARISFLDNCFFRSRDVGNIGIICSALCICFLTFSLTFYIVHPSSIYGFWLHFSYIQTYLIDIST